MMKSNLLAGVALAIVVTTAAMGPAQAKAAQQQQSFSIPAGDLKVALDAYVRATGRQLIYRTDEVHGIRSPGVRGSLSADAALGAVLRGTGFIARTDSSGSIAIVSAEGNAASLATLASTDPGEAASSLREDNTSEPSEGQTIVVTGTKIRGVTPESSPLQVITRQEMDARGATTAEQVVNSLTQNFNSVNANGISADREGFFNADAVNGVDLRGLGPGTSLVLINGRRLSGSTFGLVVDLSLIPLAAVERVEVLTDSASSLYGSDAVGGVVNFILRNRFEGLEATAAYGTDDSGTHDEFRSTATGGINWTGGNFVASANYFTRSALSAHERDFSDEVGGRYYLVPPEERYGVFLSANQKVGERLRLQGDALYSRRNATGSIFRDIGLIPGFGYYTFTSEIASKYDSYFGSVGATYDASEALIFDLVGSVSYVSGDTVHNTVSSILPPSSFATYSKALTYDFTGSASGRMVELPAGSISYSLGGGLTREKVDTDNGAGPRQRDRTTTYAFGELKIPLIGPDQKIHGVHRLEANLSARYSDYSDFGKNFSPKVGLLWAPAPGFHVRGSYGRSFRAPYLRDINNPGTYQVFDVVARGFPNPLAEFGLPTDGSPIGIYIDDGTDPNVGPETAKLIALGTDWAPPAIPGLSLSATFFRIDYRNRIARGDSSRGVAYFLQPLTVPELFNFSPTAQDIAEIGSNAALGLGSNVTGFDLTDVNALIANVDYILDNRLRNIASSRQDSVDLRIDYAFGSAAVRYAVGGSATYILDYKNKTSPTSTPQNQVNLLGRPAALRAQGYVGVTKGPFTSRLTALYVGEYKNPYTPLSPTIDDWLTFDLAASYKFGGRGLMSGLSAHLFVRNLLDSDPPFAADLGAGTTPGLSEPIGHDPANSNPLGRFISLELRKRF